MSGSDERIADHPLRGAVDGLREAVRGMSAESRDAANKHEPRGTIDRALVVAGWTEGLLDIADPALVSPGAFDVATSQIQAATHHIRAAESNPAEVANASSYFDQLLAQSGPIVAATPAVAQTAAKVGQGLGRTLSRRTETLRSEHEALRAELGTTRADLDDLRLAATQQEDARAQALTARLDQLNASLDQIQARVEQFVESSQQSFEADQAKRERAFEAAELERLEEIEAAGLKLQERFEEQLGTVTALATDAADSIEKRAEQIRDDLKGEADETLLHVANVRAKVDKLYSIIAKEGTAGAFHDEAKSERAAADNWRFVSLGLGLAALIIAFLAAFVIDTGDTSWPHTLTKLALTIGFGGVAAYAGQQSSRHRRREEDAKQLELDLTAIGPFVEDMSDADASIRDDVRKLFVERWMASRGRVGGDGKTVAVEFPIDRLLALLAPQGDQSKS